VGDLLVFNVLLGVEHELGMRTVCDKCF